MTCTYNHIQKNWETPFEEPVTFLCGNLALCEGHLYTRTAVKPREEYSLEPCTSDDLRALMTDGLNPGPIVFTGTYTEALDWIRREVEAHVKAYREDLTIGFAHPFPACLHRRWPSHLYPRPSRVWGGRHFIHPSPPCR